VSLSYAFDSQSRLRFLRTHLVFRIIEDFLNKRTRRERLLSVSREALTRALYYIYLRVFSLRFETILRDVSLLVASIANALVSRIFDKVFFKITKRKLTRAFTTIFSCRLVAIFTRSRNLFFSIVRTLSKVIVRS